MSTARDGPLIGLPSRWPAPMLSTGSLEAAASYRDGIATLVAGAPFATALLERAVAADPGFLLAGVGLTVADAIAGRHRPVTRTCSPVTRGERQHDDIVTAFLDGDLGRADDLRRVHLLEYPGDVLIVWLPACVPRIPLLPLETLPPPNEVHRDAESSGR